MTDRDLLQFAAKAAGIAHVLCYETARNCFRIGDRKSYALWRPLTDDGDALRLAVKLHIFDAGNFKQLRLEETRANPARSDLEITRRAIVRAAAEIGKAMP